MKQEKKCAWGKKEQNISYTWDNIKQCYTHTHTHRQNCMESNHTQIAENQ